MSSPIVEQWRSWVESGLKGPKGFAYIIEHHPIELEARQPGLRADGALRYAIEIAFAYPDHPLILAFAKRSYELASWGVQVTKVAHYDSLEGDRYEARRCKSYTGSMLGLAGLDRQLLRGAAEDLLLYIESGPSEGGWHSGVQSECLEAATLFLLAGEIERAKALLSMKRFKQFKPWQQGLMELAVALGSGKQVRISDVPYFEELFQQFRPREEPEWMKGYSLVSSHTLRLEFCLLRYLHVTHPHEPIVWTRVFEQIGGDLI